MLRAFKNRKLLEAGIDEAGRGPLFEEYICKQ